MENKKRKKSVTRLFLVQLPMYESSPGMSTTRFISLQRRAFLRLVVNEMATNFVAPPFLPHWIVISLYNAEEEEEDLCWATETEITYYVAMSYVNRKHSQMAKQKGRVEVLIVANVVIAKLI